MSNRERILTRCDMTRLKWQPVVWLNRVQITIWPIKCPVCWEKVKRTCTLYLQDFCDKILLSVFLHVCTFFSHFFKDMTSKCNEEGRSLSSETFSKISVSNLRRQAVPDLSTEMGMNIFKKVWINDLWIVLRRSNKKKLQRI